VMVPALHHPVGLAEQAAIVDLISDGRLELGFGVGYRAEEFRAFGADLGRRFEIFEERIGELRRAWESGWATPRPVQDPIPLWGGVGGPRGARIVGRLGLGLLTLRDDPWESYLAGLDAGGHDVTSARVAGGLFAVLADDPDATFSLLAGHIEHFWNSYLAAGVVGTGRPAPQPMTAAECRRRGASAPPGFDVLTPEGAANLVRRLAGGRAFEGVWFWASVAGMPDDVVVRNLELIAGPFKALVGQARATEPP
jgi:alkanesulfonate monooxygenase SsuD/methylene tetrahydromethanopterin reductase-like flavin-dependent oxidoreductase (luciferase family)